MRILILLAGLLTSLPAGAQEELRFGMGASHETNAESTYGWQLDYAQGLGDHSYLSIGWLNEGHQENQHRDGFTVQLWGRADLLERLSLGFGIGPYTYFDTERDEPHQSFAPYGNKHGVRPLYSAELTWYLSRSWLLYLRANRIDIESQLHTSMLLLGLGYGFGGRPIPGSSSNTPSPIDAPLDDELAVYLGSTTLNSFESERSTAYALEYRHSLERHADWTLGWLNEGGNDIIRRNGITSELWLVQALFGERVTLGAGAGAYIAVNQQDQTFVVVHHKVTGVGSDDDRVSGIVTLMASYRFDAHWSGRISFNRLVTRYDRDADVILLGMGYGF